MADAPDGTASFYSKDTYDVPIGLARDGHLIIGPYKKEGGNFGCDDRDVCNGAFIDGQYVYVGSATFPYVVGCWGPGPDPVHAPKCSSSGCGETVSVTDVPDDGTDGSNGAIESITTSIATMAVAIAACVM